MSPQNQSTTGQKAHRRNTSINNTPENPVTDNTRNNSTYLKPIDTLSKKSHLNNLLNDNVAPLTPPPTPSKFKKIDANLSKSSIIDIRSMFFILMFCGSLVVFLGALSGLGLPFDDDLSELSIINVNNINDSNIVDQIDNINNDDFKNDNIIENSVYDQNENIDLVENNVIIDQDFTEVVNPVQDSELPPEDDMKSDQIEINEVKEEKDDIIDDIEDEGLNPSNENLSNNNDAISKDENKLNEFEKSDKEIDFNFMDGLPNKLKNKKNNTIPIRYDVNGSENQNQDYPINDYSNYVYMRHKTHFTYDDVIESLSEEEREFINKTQILEMNTDESLDTSCGSWQHNYSRLHEDILSGNEVQRYISYICDDKNNCGGLSDRILGMTSAFIFALLTNRAFLADWQTPFPLETIFNSPNIDWSHDSLNPSSDIRELETSELNVIDFDAKNLDQQFMLSNWTTKYQSPFIKFYSNRGMIIRSFDSKFYSQSLKELGLRPHTTFGCVLDYLFRPAPNALSFISQYTSLFALPSIFTVGIQINTQNEFNSLQDYEHYFNCADQLTQTYAAPYQKVIYYLVTDSSELRNEAVQKFEHLIVSGLSTNSNLDNLDNPDSVNNAIIESWIFSKTDYRVISPGNYGKLSAFYSKQLHSTISIDNDNKTLDCTKEDTFITFIKLASESSLG
ncbi:hypothetical protein C1645_872777 [Glomus cerebriforme]|uniref:Uncharacterized protein n=1 Tax=Glomus cerebriforme TaxID=658196 RepID=A0A397TC34_9GLOM|nr:hypothetical protein C1645_872777 [Glomus cerebriforme]